VTTRFTNLEPNHTITAANTPTGEVLIVVVCPFTDEEGNAFESSWDVTADPDEVNCLYCEFLGGGWTDHGCLDSGDRDLAEA
jgi:hypothetical protein